MWWCGLDCFHCMIQWKCNVNQGLCNLPWCMWIGTRYSLLRPGSFPVWIKRVYSRQRSDLPPQTPLSEFLFSTCYKLNHGWSCIWPPIYYATDGPRVNLRTQTQSTQSLCVRLIYHSDSFMIPYKVATRRVKCRQYKWNKEKEGYYFECEIRFNLKTVKSWSS